MRIAVLLLASSLAWISTDHQQAARDAVAQPTPPGHGSLAGTVVDDEAQAKAVRRAIVTLAGPDLRPSRGAVTDDEGKFSFANLPSGRFTITITRPGFITSMYGAKRPARPGTPVSLGEGQHIDGLVARIWRGAAIAGVVRDEAGVPVARIPVTAIPSRQPSSPIVLSLNNNGVVTNENGEYRIFGLEAGTYVVMAQPGSAGGTAMTSLTDDAVDAEFAAIRRKSAPPASAALPAAGAAKPFAYAPVYYPGAGTLAHATQLTLAPGGEQTGIDIAVQRISTAVVSGTIAFPDGRPAGGVSVQLRLADSGSFVAAAPTVINASSRADGTFVFLQVTPGDYHLMARGTTQPPAPAQRPDGGEFMVTPPQPGAASLWATSEVSVAGSDIHDVALSLAPGVTISGVVKCDDPSKPPIDFTKMRITPRPLALMNAKPGTPIDTLATFLGVSPKADGTFQMVNISPGVFRLNINGPGIDAQNWWTRSFVAGDRDLLDGDLEITQGMSFPPAVLTLSSHHTELSGVLQTASGAPNSDVFVIAFPEDRAEWKPGTRRVQAVRPGIDGRYTLQGLPPGKYLLGAITDIDQDDWQDPALLERLVPASITITIGEGERKTQDLRIGG